MFARSDLSFSLAATPNFCSSSMMSKPKSCHSTDLPISLWVPMRMSILPALRSVKSSLISLADLSRLMYSMRTGKFFIRSVKVL